MRTFGILLFGLTLLKHVNCLVDNKNNKIFENYLNEIKAGADLTADPCTNFKQYACGAIEPLAEKSLWNHLYFISRANSMTLLRSFIDKKSHSVEHKVKSFMDSCKQERSLKLMFEQIDALKTMGKWPTDHNLTSQELARLLAKLYVFTIYPIQDGLVLKFHIVEEIFTPESVVKTLLEAGVPNAEAQQVATEIIDFQKKLQAAESFGGHTLNQINVQSIDNLQKHIPNFDWTEYITVLQSQLNFDLKTTTFNPISMSKIIDVISSTNSSTVANYIIYPFIDYTSDKMICEYHLPYFKPMLIKKFVENLSETDLNKFEEILKSFSSGMSKVKENIKGSFASSVEDQVQRIRNLLANRNEIFTEQLINDYYRTIDVDSNKFYENVWNFGSNLNKQIINSENNKAAGVLHNILTLQYDDLFDYNALDKPILYHYTTLNKNLWRMFFDSFYNSPFKPSVKTCLEQYGNSSLESLLHEFEYLKISHANYIQFASNSNEIDNERYSKLIGLGDSKRTYFTILAQNDCINDYIFKALPYLPEFIEAFQCRPVMQKWEEDCLRENVIGNFWPLENIIENK